MAVDFRDEAPAILKDYLIYKQTIKNMSKKTVDEYFIDLRTFFRFLKVMRGLVPDGTEFDGIKIDDVDLDLIKTVNLELAYDYMNFLSVIVTFFAILILVIAIIGLRKVGKKQTVILLLGIISVLFIILGLIFIIPNMWRNIGIIMLIIGVVILAGVFLLTVK